ncbi:MAG: RecQ family ATP-dependent DNA helicase, partial [Saprospiraceae bacterium]
MITQAIHKILKDKFGYDHFRPLQEEAITTVIEGQDVLLVLPTGGGKSLCFQVPALAKKGMSIVVSPLIALMDDQVIALRENGINAHAIHSNVTASDLNEAYEKVFSEETSIIYMSPERLLTESMLQYLSNQKVSLFAIDEAHCVSVWGNDFRPEYEKLKLLKEKFPTVPTIALTATADNATQKDIIEKLALSQPKHLLGSFERKNITITARPGIERIKEIRKFINKYEGEAGIIYCLSRKACESVAESLQSYGLEAAYYHAGMSSNDRKHTHNKFLYDDIKIICATIAFGMGIDKSNIRWVIHYNMPKNLEGYYQEIGRSGRDGEPAEVLLFSSTADLVKLRSFIDGSEANEKFKIIQSQKLNRMWEFANAHNCRTNMILNYFGEFRSEPCGHCDNCIHPVEMIDGKIIAQKTMSAISRSHERLSLRNLI